MSDDEIRGHLVWEAKQILSHLGPEDMTATELAAMVAAIGPAHARWLDAALGRNQVGHSAPVLSLVRQEEDRNRLA